MTDRPSGAIEVTNMVGVDGEGAPYRHSQLGRSGGGDTDACIRKRKRRRRERAPDLAVVPDPSVEQEIRRPGVPVVDRNRLYPHLVPLVDVLENIGFRDLRRLVEIGEEITPAEDVATGVVVDLAGELVFVLYGGSSHIGQLAASSVRQRDVFQEVLRHRVDLTCGNLVIRERRAGDRIHELGTWKHVREISVALGRRWNESDLPARRGADSGALISAEVEQLVFLDGPAGASAKLI